MNGSGFRPMHQDEQRRSRVIVFGVLAVVLGISMVVFARAMADFFNGFSPTTLDSTRFRIGGGIVAGLGIVMSGIALMQ